MSTPDPHREPLASGGLPSGEPPAPTPETRPERVPVPEELATGLQRIERLLVQIHGLLDTTQRVRNYREFSIAGFAAALLQVLVILLTIAAFMDWMYRVTEFGLTLVKLGLATVLQLAALTAFFVAAQRNTER
ncbi:MAG: hypothetical protein IPM18_04290 [Phycisphaerales bacterium]|nr:hypothetical protein [Phycisphaerales bacterium]